MSALLLDIKKDQNPDTVYSSIENRKIVFPRGTHYAVILPYKNKDMSGGVGYTTHMKAQQACEKALSLESLGINCIIVCKNGSLKHIETIPDESNESGVFYCLNSTGTSLDCIVL